MKKQSVCISRYNYLPFWIILLLSAIPLHSAVAGGNTISEMEPEMIYISSGSFIMGNKNGDRYKREEPAHTVHIDSFLIGKYEVTHKQWHSVMGSNPPRFRGCQSCPVEGVNWDQIHIYIKKLNIKTGKQYRLPTEAEWEYSARAGSETRFPWGNKMGNNANCRHCGDLTNITKAMPVGSFPANKFGLHDVIGNAWEWTQDCWNDNYNGAPNDGSAWLDGDCNLRVLRGGAWIVEENAAYVTYRARQKTSYVSPLFNGFRLAHD